MIELRFYTTLGCHLCELAEALLIEAQAHHSITITRIEISDNDELMNRYGIRIPVIQFPDDSELGWPFELTDIDSKLIQH